MRKIFYLLCTLPLGVFAQTEYSSFTSTGRGGATSFVTDYQACGINPANLGWGTKFQDKNFALGFNEATYSIHTTALQKDEFRKSIMEVVKDKEQNFTMQQKQDAAKSFTDAPLALNLDFGVFGFAYMDDKFGGIAFRVNDRIQWYSKLGSNASNLLFLGKYDNSTFDSLQVLLSNGDTSMIANNASAYANMDPDSILAGISSVPKLMSKILKDSEISLAWTREWNISYGRKLFGDSTFAMYAGVGFKYIQGLGILSITSDGQNLEAFSSLSPLFNNALDFDYDQIAQQATNVVSQPDKKGFAIPKPVGSGFGLDFGFNFVVKNKFKFAASLINMGSVTWDGNVYTVEDTALVSTTSIGANNYNFFTEISDMLEEGGYLKLVGTKSKTVKLPSMLRAGASLKVGKKVELGVDAIMPFNEVSGSYEKAVIGFGGDVAPAKWIKLSAGFVTGGNYGFQIPVGLTLIGGMGSYEFGIASRDAINFFTQNGPTLSLSTGFMRFRF